MGHARGGRRHHPEVGRHDPDGSIDRPAHDQGGEPPRGVEADLHTAQAFEALGAALTGAVGGAWQIDDADQGAGIAAFAEKGERWVRRPGLAGDFWVEGPIVP